MAASARTSKPPERYLLALGSNQRHQRYGSPAKVLRAAVEALAASGIAVEAVSPILDSAPLGPSRRRYANGAAMISTGLAPDALLTLLHRIEADFGRRRSGRRWASRVLDLDVVLWDGGAWSSVELTIPHVAFRSRAFVLAPAATIAPDWRDPLTGLTLRHLRFRQARRLTSGA